MNQVGEGVVVVRCERVWNPEAVVPGSVPPGDERRPFVVEGEAVQQI